MITGHKELISWVGEDGKRVRGLAMWFIGPRHGIVIKLPTVRLQIVSFVSNILAQKKCPTSVVCAFPSHMRFGVPWAVLGQLAVRHGPDAATALAVVNHRVVKDVSEL